MKLWYLILATGLLGTSNTFGMDYLSKFKDEDDERFSASFDSKDLSDKLNEFRRVESDLVEQVILVLKEGTDPKIITRSIPFRRISKKFGAQDPIVGTNKGAGIIRIPFTQETKFKDLVAAYQNEFFGVVYSVSRAEDLEDIFRERESRNYLTHKDSKRRASISNVQKK